MEKKMFDKALPFIFERVKVLRSHLPLAAGWRRSYPKEKPRGYKLRRLQPEQALRRVPEFMQKPAPPAGDGATEVARP